MLPQLGLSGCGWRALEPYPQAASTVTFHQGFASIPDIFDKLNWAGRTEILVLNAPDSFESALQRLRDARAVGN